MSWLKQYLGARNPYSIPIVATALVKQYKNMPKEFFYQNMHSKGKRNFSMSQFIFISPYSFKLDLSSFESPCSVFWSTLISANGNSSYERSCFLWAYSFKQSHWKWTYWGPYLEWDSPLTINVNITTKKFYDQVIISGFIRRF